MKNEPQLTAEMEIVTKFRQFLANWDYAHLTRKVSVEESRQMCDEFALTLATALEDERNKVIEEVEETLKGLDCGFCNYEDEVKIRLNQLKEGKC